MKNNLKKFIVVGFGAVLLVTGGLNVFSQSPSDNGMIPSSVAGTYYEYLQNVGGKEGVNQIHINTDDGQNIFFNLKSTQQIISFDENGEEVETTVVTEQQDLINLLNVTPEAVDDFVNLLVDNPNTAYNIFVLDIENGKYNLNP
jgi:hypothetical protein